MTDTPPDATAVPAVAAPAQAVFVQPPEYATGMALASAISGLLLSDQGVMPEKVAAQLSAFGGAGADLNVQEAQVEALYDWACLGTDCPDDARRVAYGGASLFAKYSFGIMGKAPSPDQPKRADGIRLELRRQMGDPGSASVTEAERPAPQGLAVPAPVVRMITVTEADVAAMLGQLKAAHASGDLAQVETAITAAEAKLAPAEDAAPQPDAAAPGS